MTAFDQFMEARQKVSDSELALVRQAIVWKGVDDTDEQVWQALKAFQEALTQLILASYDAGQKSMEVQRGQSR